MKNTLILLTVLFPLSIFGQEQKTRTIEFHVESVCAMCEKSIENALDARGIISGDYNLETQLATVIFKPWKISESEIHTLINEAGYDTDKSRCTDEQYSRVHGCCKYRELQKH
jgi:mercuric ion binding protein